MLGETLMSQLQQQLSEINRGKLKPVYLVQGTEQYLLDRVKSAIMEAVLDQQETSDFNFGVFDMEAHTLEEAVREAESFPFFGGQRLVIVTNPYFLTGEKKASMIEHNTDSLISYIQNPADFSVMMIIAPYDNIDKRKKLTKQLYKQAEIIDVSPLKPTQLTQYVQQSIHARGYRLQDGAFKLLIERTDYNLTHIMSELEKLYLYHADESVITRQSVSQLVSQSLESNIFDINRLVLSQQANEAIQVFHDLLLQKEEPLKLLAIMLGQFRLLLQVKILRTKGYQQGEIAKLINTHPYRVKLASNMERQFNQTILSQAYQRLIDTEYKIKTGQVDPVVQFELFVMQFSQS